MRIFARLQEGWSYETIAQQENLSRERIRQIVSDTLAARAIEPRRDHTRLQIARLDPALRLAAGQVAAGDLRAVDRLLRVLDRLDKYQGVAAAMGDAPGDNRSYEELLAKLGRMAARRKEATAAGNAPSGAGQRPPGAPPAADDWGEVDSAISKFFPSQRVENNPIGRE
jgi:hypothetical protein